MKSLNTTTAAGATSTNDTGGVVAAGNPTSSDTINNTSQATLGANVNVTATVGDVSLKADSEDLDVQSEADVTAGSILVVVDTSNATTSLTDPATATVGPGLTHHFFLSF